MSKLNISHISDFRWREKEGQTFFEEGFGEASNHEFWADGERKSFGSNKTIDISFNPNKILKYNRSIIYKDSQHTCLSKLEPLKVWISKNEEKISSIKPNIICNRNVIRHLLDPGIAGKFDENFDIIRDAKYPNWIELHSVVKKSENCPDLSLGLAFEQYIAKGGIEEPSIDDQKSNYRVYRVILLEVGEYKVLYTAQIDAVMDVSDLFAKCDNPNKSFILENSACEMKFKNDQRFYLNTEIKPSWALNWFTQCHLAKVDCLIMGINPHRNNIKYRPQLSNIRVYTMESLAKVVDPTQTIESLEEKMGMHLKEILMEVMLCTRYLCGIRRYINPVLLRFRLANPDREEDCKIDSKAKNLNG